MISTIHSKVTYKDVPWITFASHASLLVPQIIGVAVVQECKLFECHARPMPRTLVDLSIRKSTAGESRLSVEDLEGYVAPIVDATARSDGVGVTWTRGTLTSRSIVTGQALALAPLSDTQTLVRTFHVIMRGVGHH